MKLLTWLRNWVSGLLVLGALAVGAWWFMQQTASYRALEELIRRHPAVAQEVGRVSEVELPFFGWGIDWTDARIDPDFDVRVIGSKGQAAVHAEFRDGSMTRAWMATASGVSVPLIVPE